MAAGPDGSVYVVDQTEEDILRWSPGSGFVDVAGDGHQGFGGDGGPATKASFDLTWGSSITVGRDGTVFIYDTGNGRVRAVAPDGIVRTVIGGGTAPLSGAEAAPRSVNLLDWPQLGGLAIGPNGELYLGAENGVYRLAGSTLRRVVGVDERTFPSSDYQSYVVPQEIRFDDAADLAFDGRGDLVIGSGDLPVAYELSSTGIRYYLGSIRGGGSAAALTEGVGGSVAVATGRAGFEWLTPTRTFLQVSNVGDWSIRSSGLSATLGGRNFFLPGSGIAVSTAGDVFVDTDVGNSWTGVSALAEVTPSGQVRAIWRS